MIPAIVLAGAPNDGCLREVSPAPFEALIEVGGRPLAAYVLDALLTTEDISRIVVVAPEQLARAYTRNSRLTFIPPKGKLLETCPPPCLWWPTPPRSWW